jgi:energy-converting hydrogenase Eha subunit A
MTSGHYIQVLVGAIFVVAVCAAIVVDLLLVFVLRTKSISLRTWIATKSHPTLIIAGCLATLVACWLLRGSWPLASFAGFLGGHLFAHW